MKRFAILMLLLIGVLTACTYAPQAAPTAQTLPGRAPDYGLYPQSEPATPTPFLVSTVVIGIYSDYSARVLSDTATPWPAWTPAPSATPIPSNTPLSPTPTASYTPDIEPSPTMEDTAQPTLTPPPTNTPRPTATNTPEPVKCWGTVTAGILNVRSGPWGPILGTVSAGDILTFEAKWYADFWWYILYWTPTQAGFVSSNYIEIGDTADCSEIPDMTPPDETGSEMVVAWFSMPNGNVNEQIESVVVGKARGIPGGTHVYSNVSICLQVMDAGGVCSFRHGNPDCPTNIFQGDPRAVARDFMKYDAAYAEGVFQEPRYKGLIYLDPLNECGWGELTWQFEWWGAFFDEYISQAAARHWPPLMLPSVGPGYGDLPMFTIWQEELRLLNQHGGMFAMHVYNPTSTWLCPVDQWLADRTKYNHDILVSLGVDIPIAVTEVGQGWGDTPPNVSDMTCWVNRAATYPFLKFVAIWYNGSAPHPTWPNANWQGLVVPFMRALDAVLWQ